MGKIGTLRILGYADDADILDKTADAMTARLSPAPDKYMAVHAVCDIEPDDPVNISILLALECTQGARQNCRINDVACENM